MTQLLFDREMGREQRSIGPHAVGVSVGTSFVTIIEYECEEEEEALIRAWGFDCGDAEKALLTLVLEKNGSPVPDYPDGITALFAGFRANELEEVWIPMKAGDKVRLKAKLSSGSTTAKGRFKGLVWEKES